MPAKLAILPKARAKLLDDAQVVSTTGAPLRLVALPENFQKGNILKNRRIFAPI